MARLTDKVVVITGGMGRLGKQFARAVATEGGLAVIGDVNLAGFPEFEKSVTDAGLPGRLTARELDITRPESIQNLIGSLTSQGKRIDALVNNAYPRNPRYGRKFEEVAYPDFCENLSLHLGGYFLMMQQFGEYFRRQGGGTIVNISSVYGVIAPRFDIYEGQTFSMPVEYAAIKSAILHLTRYLASYYKGTGIRVNALSPGGIFADHDPEFARRYAAHSSQKGLLDPQDITGTLLFLLSDDSQFMNGQNLIVDDGFTL